jgi:hypothetical protein
VKKIKKFPTNAMYMHYIEPVILHFCITDIISKIGTLPLAIMLLEALHNLSRVQINNSSENPNVRE